MRVSITVSLFAVILSVAFVLAVPLVLYTHVGHRESNLIAANEIMERSANTLQLKFKSLVASAEMITNNLSIWPGVEVPPSAQPHPTRAFLIDQLRRFPHLSTISIGFDDGSYYMIGTARSRPSARLQKLNAPENTVLIEQSIFHADNGRRLSVRRFLDADGNTLHTTRSDAPDYDPRTRAWYIPGESNETNQRSEIYQFAGTGEPGLTISRRHPRGTVGIDLTLNRMEEFLRDEPQAISGMLAIFRADGTVLASTVNDDAHREALRDLMDRLRETPGFQSGVLSVQGAPWVARVSMAPISTNTEEILALAVPVSVIAAPVSAVTRTTLIVSVLVILGSVPVIWVISRGISRPLVTLAQDADCIRRFDLAPRTPANSAVDEIHQLQSAMQRMRTSLGVFSHYVPKALVQKLIQRNEIPHLGGSRRTITVLFMDIENFTAMSADLEPEEVMRRMSEYFEVVTQVLLAHGATIDKYIGDAVMAFWNAPDETPDHEFMTCCAALEIQNAAAAVTDRWTDVSVPVRTRIGLHSGEAVVGNVGSSDRMNFTALGATVNLAARLETLNRDLGTSILVSKQIVMKCEERLSFESVTTTKLKGFAHPIECFVLKAGPEQRPVSSL